MRGAGQFIDQRGLFVLRLLVHRSLRFGTAVLNHVLTPKRYGSEALLSHRHLLDSQNQGQYATLGTVALANDRKLQEHEAASFLWPAANIAANYNDLRRTKVKDHHHRHTHIHIQST